MVVIKLLDQAELEGTLQHVLCRVGILSGFLKVVRCVNQSSRYVEDHDFCTLFFFKIFISLKEFVLCYLCYNATMLLFSFVRIKIQVLHQRLIDRLRI